MAPASSVNPPPLPLTDKIKLSERVIYSDLCVYLMPVKIYLTSGLGTFAIRVNPPSREVANLDGGAVR
jgi:hypothetical protein